MEKKGRKEKEGGAIVMHSSGERRSGERKEGGRRKRKEMGRQHCCLWAQGGNEGERARGRRSEREGESGRSRERVRKRVDRREGDGSQSGREEEGVGREGLRE